MRGPEESAHFDDRIIPELAGQEDDMAEASVKDQAGAAVAAVAEEAKKGAAKTVDVARERLQQVAEQVGERY